MKLFMRRIRNPFTEVCDYNCFGCSPNNQMGLKMEFFEDGEEIVSIWNPEHHFDGYINVLHGGIQSTLIDEIAYWTVLIKLKTSGVTARLDVRLKKPLYTNNGKIRLRAKLAELKGRVAIIDVKIYNSEKEICASAKVYYYTYPLEESIKSHSYPANYDVFFEN